MTDRYDLIVSGILWNVDLFLDGSVYIAAAGNACGWKFALQTVVFLAMRWSSAGGGLIRPESRQRPGRLTTRFPFLSGRGGSPVRKADACVKSYVVIKMKGRMFGKIDIVQ